MTANDMQREIDEIINGLTLVCETCDKQLVIPGWLSWGEDTVRHAFCKPECKQAWYNKVKNEKGVR